MAALPRAEEEEVVEDAEDALDGVRTPDEAAREALIASDELIKQFLSIDPASVARKELCLHYYSTSVEFEFGDHADVHRLDTIREWAELDQIRLDSLRENIVQVSGGAECQVSIVQ